MDETSCEGMSTRSFFTTGVGKKATENQCGSIHFIRPADKLLLSLQYGLHCWHGLH